MRGKEAAGGADALTQSVHLWFGRRVQRHRQEVVEVDGMGLTLDQAGQAAPRGLQALLLQDLADAGVHACVPEGPKMRSLQKYKSFHLAPSTNFSNTYLILSLPKIEIEIDISQGGGRGGK